MYLAKTTCAVLFIFMSGCATTDYVGTTYPPTSNVDVYFRDADVKRDFSVMGTAKTEGTEYLTFEAMEEQLVKDAMAKGADGIIVDGMDTITVGSTTTTSGKAKDKPSYVVTQDGKLKNVGGSGHYDEMSTTTDIRDHVLTARLIKYD